MDKRVFGLRNTCSVACTAGERRLSPEEMGGRLFGSGGAGRGVFLRNGGRLHLDVPGYPVYATPECGSVPDLVVHDKAGERILEGLLMDAGQRLRDDGISAGISVLKSNAGNAGSPYGCQETYLIGQRGDFGRLAGILIPFLVTRQIICGSGTVARTPRGALYCLSRAAGHTENSIAPVSARSRPLISTRDEAHPGAAGFRRLHVIVSDPTMSETTTLLKVGATDLVLRMAEAGTVMAGLALDSPLQAGPGTSTPSRGRSTGRSSTGSSSSTGHGTTCPCRRRKSPRPTWLITTSTAPAACTTSCSAAAGSTGRRATSTSSKRKPSRRSPAATGRRADPAWW